MAPQVEPVIVGGKQNPSFGVGEPVAVPVAAAMANARFDAAGVRTRQLSLLESRLWLRAKQPLALLLA